MLTSLAIVGAFLAAAFAVGWAIGEILGRKNWRSLIVEMI